MHDPLAIHIDDVSKVYQLYGSQKEQMLHVLGLDRLGLVKRSNAQEFHALKHVSLDVPKGHRIGIIGRNGAGKTTLLKLICGNFAPTSGRITVNGTVQALMNTGLGFHPEFTGMENIRSALQYNGLARAEMEDAIASIIDFCELGEFMDQPFRTYSLGMQARLMFAAATAVKPDILIVDEVLGAGDAYFIAKSKARVENLINNGATMLLVSHSTQQVLELCSEVIWMHQGEIRMQGDALTVVKAYEEYIHGQAMFEAWQERQHTQISSKAVIAAPEKPREPDRPTEHLQHVRFQEPRFIPHGAAVALPAIAPPTELKFQARGGISRWEGSQELSIVGFTIANEFGETNQLMSMRPAKCLLTIEAHQHASFQCRYAFVAHNALGHCVLDVLSPIHSFEAKPSSLHTVEVIFNPLQLGPGEYNITISVHEYGPIEQFNATKRHDLLGRSFTMQVDLPDSLRAIETAFYHSAEWAYPEPVCSS